MISRRAGPSAAVGVDAGGTWVRAVLRSGKRARRLRASSKPGLPAVLARMFRSWGLRRADALVVGSRGVWRGPERRRLARALAPLARRILVMSDLELAWLSALDGGRGVLVLSGTGSAAFGRAGRRRTRAGGLGPLLGDEGSAFWVGRAWLKSGPERRALAFARRPDAVRAVASLARGVVARAGRDRRARAILEEAAGHLASLAARAARPLGLRGGFNVSWAGGMLSDARFRGMFARRLARELPSAVLRAPLRRPEDAASLLLE